MTLHYNILKFFHKVLAILKILFVYLEWLKILMDALEDDSQAQYKHISVGSLPAKTIVMCVRIFESQAKLWSQMSS